MPPPPQLLPPGSDRRGVSLGAAHSPVPPAGSYRPARLRRPDRAGRPGPERLPPPRSDPSKESGHEVGNPWGHRKERTKGWWKGCPSAFRERPRAKVPGGGVLDALQGLGVLGTALERAAGWTARPQRCQGGSADVGPEGWRTCVPECAMRRQSGWEGGARNSGGGG